MHYEAITPNIPSLFPASERNENSCMCRSWKQCFLVSLAKTKIISGVMIGLLEGIWKDFSNLFFFFEAVLWICLHKISTRMLTQDFYAHANHAHTIHVRMINVRVWILHAWLVCAYDFQAYDRRAGTISTRMISIRTTIVIFFAPPMSSLWFNYVSS